MRAAVILLALLFQLPAFAATHPALAPIEPDHESNRLPLAVRAATAKFEAKLSKDLTDLEATYSSRVNTEGDSLRHTTQFQDARNKIIEKLREERTWASEVFREPRWAEKKETTAILGPIATREEMTRLAGELVKTRFKLTDLIETGAPQPQIDAASTEARRIYERAVLQSFRSSQSIKNKLNNLVRACSAIAGCLGILGAKTVWGEQPYGAAEISTLLVATSAANFGVAIGNPVARLRAKLARQRAMGDFWNALRDIYQVPLPNKTPQENTEWILDSWLSGDKLAAALPAPYTAVDSAEPKASTNQTDLCTKLLVNRSW